MKKWEIVQTIECPDIEGLYRVTHEHGTMVIEREVEVEEWEDITEGCTPYSHHIGKVHLSMGISYRGEEIASIAPEKGIIARSGYKVELPNSYTFAMKVYKKR